MSPRPRRSARLRGPGPRVRRGLAVGLVLSGLLGGCGLPNGGGPQLVAAQDVPYGLLDPAPTVVAPTRPDIPVSAATVYLVDGSQRLVPLPVQVSQAPLQALVQALLNRLAVGPTDRERAQGLLTDLGPGASLTVRSIRDGTATIELTPVQDPSPGRFPVAVGQVVLTATSVVGVTRVRFVQEDGTVANVPAPPAGDLTTTPLAATDYVLLLTPGQDIPKRTVPLPDPAPTTTGPAPGS
ncbi:MAG: GerMN domain-containing protein [Lapillicoccus sp.]